MRQKRKTVVFSKMGKNVFTKIPQRRKLPNHRFSHWEPSVRPVTFVVDWNNSPAKDGNNDERKSEIADDEDSDVPSLPSVQKLPNSRGRETRSARVATVQEESEVTDCEESQTEHKGPNKKRKKSIIPRVRSIQAAPEPLSHGVESGESFVSDSEPSTSPIIEKKAINIDRDQRKSIQRKVSTLNDAGTSQSGKKKEHQYQNVSVTESSKESADSLEEESDSLCLEEDEESQDGGYAKRSAGKTPKELPVEENQKVTSESDAELVDIDEERNAGRAVQELSEESENIIDSQTDTPARRDNLDHDGRKSNNESTPLQKSVNKVKRRISQPQIEENNESESDIDSTFEPNPNSEEQVMPNILTEDVANSVSESEGESAVEPDTRVNLKQKSSITREDLEDCVGNQSDDESENSSKHVESHSESSEDNGDEPVESEPEVERTKAQKRIAITDHISHLNKKQRISHVKNKTIAEDTADADSSNNHPKSGQKTLDGFFKKKAVLTRSQTLETTPNVKRHSRRLTETLGNQSSRQLRNRDDSLQSKRSKTASDTDVNSSKRTAILSQKKVSNSKESVMVSSSRSNRTVQPSTSKRSEQGRQSRSTLDPSFSVMESPVPQRKERKKHNRKTMPKKLVIENQEENNITGAEEETNMEEEENSQSDSQSLYMWNGGGRKRSVYNALDLDVVLNSVEEVAGNYRASLSNIGARKAIREFFKLFQDEITDVIDLVEERKHDESKLRKKMREVKSLRTELLDAEKETSHLKLKLFNLRQEVNKKNLHNKSSLSLDKERDVLEKYRKSFRTKP